MKLNKLEEECEFKMSCHQSNFGETCKDTIKYDCKIYQYLNKFDSNRLNRYKWKLTEKHLKDCEGDY